MTSTELSVDGLKALLMMEEGHRLNCVSRVARELVELGLAMPGWADDLVISEAGRRKVRGCVRSEHVADLSAFTTMGPDVDPMASPQPSEPFEIAPEMPPESCESVVVETIRRDGAVVGEIQRGLRAAGVASGITGVWVDEKWVNAFVEAWLDDERPIFKP